MTYHDALKKQFRSPSTYARQAANLVIGLVRVLGHWMGLTILCTSAIGISLFLAEDLSAYSFAELQEGLRAILEVTAMFALILCFVANTGRFKDVFSALAWDEVCRFQAIEREVRSQADTVEGLLLKYDLITEEDVARRRKVNETPQSQAFEADSDVGQPQS